jgi:glycosyltransferase involved in cell wall biosynthesis
VTRVIVHVASGREWRGGQRQVWLLARELARLGVNQVVVTRQGSELARRLQLSSVRVRSVRWDVGLDPRVLPGILGELRRSNGVLHAHDGHALTLAGIAAGLSGAPLVATRRVTFPLRSKYFWIRAQRVIAISGAVRTSLLNDGLAPERVVVIPSAVDAEGLQSQRGPDIRARFGLPADGSMAVSLGSLTPEKDPFALVEAAAQLVRDLPGLHWILVGEGPLRAMLEARIAEHGLHDRVHLVGKLDDPHLALAGADVFVLSSVAEGLGSSVLAAMAMGVPVVATRVGGVPEVLGSDAGLLVPAENPTSLAAAVRRVLTGPGQAAELVHSARRRLQRFTPDAMATQVAEVYRSFAHSLDGS